MTFEDLIQAKQEGIPLTRLILNRYNCNYNERSEDFVSKSATLKPLMENIISGIDPRSHTDKHNDDKWYDVSKKEQYDAILESLNMRGVRENILYAGLSNANSEIVNSYEETDKLANKKLKNLNVKSEDVNDIDKNLFETMDDYIEGNLRDHLLEVEERLWLGSIGVIKCEDRLKWRSSIEQGMVKLIKYDNSKKEFVENISKDVGEDKLNEGNVCIQNGFNVSNETKDDSTNEDTEEFQSPINVLPLHITTEMTDDTSSRCSTPVTVPENEKQLVVKELAAALLLVSTI